MTVRITRTGVDQHDEIQAALNGDGDVVIADDGVLCDSTLTLPTGAVLCAENPGNGIQTMTDEGPNKDWNAMQNRQHLRIVGDNVFVHGLTITGTNPTVGRSPNIKDSTGKVHRNYLENQTGVTVVGASNVWVADVNISHVWGDLASIYPSGSGKTSEVCENVVFSGGDWHTSGRHGFGHNGGRNTYWYDCTVHDYVSSMFHIETGSNPLTHQWDIHIEKIRSSGKGGSTIHVTGRNGVKRLTAKDVFDTVECRLHVAASGPRYEDFMFDGFTWNGLIREVANLWNIDRVTLKNFAGRVMKSGSVVDPTGIVTCTDVDIADNPLIVRA